MLFFYFCNYVLKSLRKTAFYELCGSFFYLSIPSLTCSLIKFILVLKESDSWVMAKKDAAINDM